MRVPNGSRFGREHDRVLGFDQDFPLPSPLLSIVDPFFVLWLTFPHNSTQHFTAIPISFGRQLHVPLTLGSPWCCCRHRIWHLRSKTEHTEHSVCSFLCRPQQKYRRPAESIRPKGPRHSFGASWQYLDPVWRMLPGLDADNVFQYLRHAKRDITVACICRCPADSVKKGYCTTNSL